MKFGSKIVFLFKDSEGFGTTISQSFIPNPHNPHSLRSTEESFDLSLERYGIKDIKASGTIHHFVDHHDLYQVSLVLMQMYEPPVLACAVNQVLDQIAAQNSSPLPQILAPFIITSSKLKPDAQILTKKVPLYGVQLGPQTDITKALLSATEKLSCLFPIHYEPLACLLHLARILSLPTFILIGERGLSLNTRDNFGILHKIAHVLATALGLCFSEDRIQWRPKGTKKNADEPWRDLYG